MRGEESRRLSRASLIRVTSRNGSKRRESYRKNEGFQESKKGRKE